MKRKCVCGGDDHLRSSSKKCFLYSPIQDDIAPYCDDVGWKFEKAKSETVIKMSLASIINNDLFKELIDQEVKEWTIRLHGASLAFSYFVLSNDLTDKNLNFDEKFFYNLLALFVGCGDKCNVDIIKIVRSHFVDFIIPSKNQGQQICYFSKHFKQNFDSHLLKMKKIAMSRRSRISLEILGFEKTFITKAIKKMFLTLEKSNEAEEIDEVDFKDPDIDQVFKCFNYWNGFESSFDILSFLKESLDLIILAGKKTFKLVPIFSLEAKHITIDSKILYQLLKKMKIDIKEDMSDFIKKKFDSWKRHTKIPNKYFPTDYENPLPNKKYFTGMILTDGVSASIITRKWYKCRIDKEEKKELSKEEKKEFVIKRNKNLSSRSNRIGIDPGRKEIFTYVCNNGKIGSLGNKEYYHESHFRKNSFIRNKMMKADGFKEWDFPSLKTIEPDIIINYKSWIIPLVKKIIDLKCSKKWKKMKLDSYIMKKKTLDNSIKKMIEKSGGDKNSLVIGFGDASFNHASKGHAACPRRLWAVDRMKKIHGLKVLSVSEFNTSRVCHNCHSLDGLDDCEDAHSPHFVRQCLNTVCQTIWNRDVNASLNILQILDCMLALEEKPFYFKKSLKKLRALNNASEV